MWNFTNITLKKGSNSVTYFSIFYFCILKQGIAAILTKYSKDVEYFKYQADGPCGYTYKYSSPILVDIVILQPSSLKFYNDFKNNNYYFIL